MVEKNNGQQWRTSNNHENPRQKQHPQQQQQQQYYQKQTDTNLFQQRSGLLPTDGHDAYKRSTNRASRRSRNERTSYLMATGHLDPEETYHLNGLSEHAISMETSNSVLTPATSGNGALQRDTSEERGLRVSTKRPNFEPSFLDNLNRALANSPVNGQNSSFQQQHFRTPASNTSRPSQKRGDSSRKSKNQSSLKVKGGSYRYHNTNNNNENHDTSENDTVGRGKFRQTYTEVTLPMKTSPAFDYILKDNRRRNKRCFLWFLYSILMIVCLSVIIWASIMIGRSAHK